MTSSAVAMLVPYARPNNIIAVGVILPVLCIIAFMLRIYARSTRKQILGVDDWLLIPAVFFVIGAGACLIAGVEKRAFGYPSAPPGAWRGQNEYPSDTSIAAHLEFVILLLLVPAYTLIKLSILFFYQRLFVHQRSNLGVIVWVLMAVTIGWGIAFFFLFLLNCGVDIKENWGPRPEFARNCSIYGQSNLAFYISEFIMNIILIVLPLPTIWRLHIVWSRKLAVTGIMLTAFMALVASIIRLVLILQITALKFDTANAVDVEMFVCTLFYWGVIECGLALVACCLPTLKPLIARPKRLSSVISLQYQISGQSRTDGSRSSWYGSRYDTHQMSNPSFKEDIPLRGDVVMDGRDVVGGSQVVKPKRVLEIG